MHGIDGLIADDEIASYLTPSAVVAGAGQHATVAIDGELVDLAWPLEFELLPGAVMVARR